MKRTSAQNMRLGIFVVLGSLVFILAVFFIGRQQNLFGSTAELNATFSNVNGLQLGNNVRFSGIDIGTVRNIKMINDTTIIVNMRIQKDIMPHISKNAVAVISTDGLVGSMVVSIMPGKTAAPPIESGDSITSFARVSTDDILTTLDITNKNAALLTADLLKISKQITQGHGTVGTLLNDTEMADNMKHTFKLLKQSSVEASATIQKLNHLANSLDADDNMIGVINDTAVAGQIRNIIYNLDRSSVATDSITANLDTVVRNLKSGQGAVNYLSNDKQFADNLDSLVINLNDATKLLKEDLEAAKHNFLLRGYFKKQDKKQRKQTK